MADGFFSLVDRKYAVGYGTAPPTSGIWNTNDVILNTISTGVNSPEKWVCTAGGNPGIWVAVGDRPEGWVKYTVTYTNAAFKAAATGANVTLFALPAYGAIKGIKIKHSVAFAGTAVSSLTVSIGDGNSPYNQYATAFDAFQTVSATALYIDGGAYSLSDAAHNVIARFTANTNFGNGTVTVLTAGSVDIWVKYSVIPS